MGDAVSAVDLAGLAAAGDRPGALWRLDGEELQANLIRLGLGDRIQPHRNDEVEVLMVVVAGQGELTLTAGSTRSPPWPWFTCPRGRSGRWWRSEGRLPTCRSTAADRQAFRLAAMASGGEVAEAPIGGHRRRLKMARSSQAASWP